MNLLSELISLPVINLYSGKIEGTIQNAIFNETCKKIIYLKLFNDEDEEYLLQTNKIYLISKDSVVIKNAEALELESTLNVKTEQNPINKQAFKLSGENLGNITDVKFNKNFNVEYLIVSNNKIEVSNILNINEVVIIKDDDSKVRLSNFKPSIKQTKDEPKSTIKIMPIINTQNKSNTTQESTTPNLPQIQTPPNEDLPELIPEQKIAFKTNNILTPQKIIGNGNFLIGRKALKTIYGINNEIIIRKDNLITEKNLEIAKKHSKLVELTVFSKIKS